MSAAAAAPLDAPLEDRTARDPVFIAPFRDITLSIGRNDVDSLEGLR